MSGVALSCCLEPRADQLDGGWQAAEGKLAYYDFSTSSKNWKIYPTNIMVDIFVRQNRKTLKN